MLVCFVMLLGVRHASNAKLLNTKGALTYSTKTPSEKRPDKKSYVWKGDPTDPKYLSLPSIKTEGFIQKVSVDQNNQVAVPNNIYMAGWFAESAIPGAKGLSIIDGHLDGKTADGIFINLAKLKPGDVYTVEFGNGSKKQFKVLSVKSMPTDQTAAVLFSQDPAAPNQLNLITCGGSYNKKAGSYDQRVVVTSQAI